MSAGGSASDCLKGGGDNRGRKERRKGGGEDRNVMEERGMAGDVGKG